MRCIVFQGEVTSIENKLKEYGITIIHTPVSPGMRIVVEVRRWEVFIDYIKNGFT
jgi:hypothetical protein